MNKRLGIMGPDFFKMVATDFDLKQEAELLDGLLPAQLVQLGGELGRLAERAWLERDPQFETEFNKMLVEYSRGDLAAPAKFEEWKKSHPKVEGGQIKSLAELIALRLLSGWLKCKAIVHTSMNRKVIKEAQDLEDHYFGHIQSLLRICHGEPAIKEEPTEKAGPGSPETDNTVMDVVREWLALQKKGASDEEWKTVLKEQGPRLKAYKDRQATLFEENVRKALKNRLILHGERAATDAKPTEEKVPKSTEPDSAPDDIVEEVLDAIEPLMMKGASEAEWDRVLKQQLAKLQGAKEPKNQPARILEKAISDTLVEGKNS